MARKSGGANVMDGHNLTLLVEMGSGNLPNTVGSIAIRDNRPVIM